MISSKFTLVDEIKNSFDIEQRLVDYIDNFDARELIK